METCCGYRVRPSTKITLPHSDFQGPTEALWTLQKPQCFKVPASLSPGEPISGSRYLTKKRQLFPGSSVDVSEFGCVTALEAETSISVSGLGNIDPIPFRSAARQTRHMFKLSTSRFGTDFSDPLGPTDPCSIAVSMEPFSTLALKGLT